MYFSKTATLRYNNMPIITDYHACVVRSKVLGTCSCICQGTSTRRQRSSVHL